MKFGIAISALLFAATALHAAVNSQAQGGVWPDTDGSHINAHGGGILRCDSTYYWYGESRPDGVGCYSSTDLLNWRNLGKVLEVTDVAGHDIERGCIIERPKVIYCEKTGKYVMWFHLELKGRGYEAARCGVAVSDRPEGPFEFIRSGRVNPGLAPMNLPDSCIGRAFDHSTAWWTPEWREQVAAGMFTVRDLEGGQMSRDMTVFVDDDGRAYHIYSSEENLTLQIAELTDDYTSHSGRYIRIFPGGHNEAPAIFKHSGRYWMIASGCTGWAPNEARLMTADNIMGEWTALPNPCRGPKAEITFGGQSNYVLNDGKGAPVAMFDVWTPGNLPDSRYIWLPIRFDDDGTPFIPYCETFTR